MFSEHPILTCITVLAIAGMAFYFSRNNSVKNLVDSVGQASSSTGVSSASTAPITNCAFDTTEIPEHVPVIMNEIAWMGDATSSNHEWIELKNVSSSTVSIGGWELANASGKIKVVFRSGAKVAAGGLYLLERGGMDFLPSIKADNFFVGIIKNAGDSFRLFDRYCSLIDQVVASSRWPAGDDATKRTMERDPKTLGWHTSSAIGGTPKAENGAAFVAPFFSKKLKKTK